MRSKVKAFIVVVGVLLVVTAIALIISGRGPLYGKAAEDNWVPNMLGVWGQESGAGYHFEDVTDPNCMPQYYEFTTSEGYMYITYQTGRVFAGEWNGRKLAGVILQDRTVSIQGFEPSEHRFFMTGKITGSGGKLQIEGWAHDFDDFGRPPIGGAGKDKGMGSGYGRLVKVN